ncbi:MAG: PhzF family phenazine biosynthesis protein [Synechococcales cyanobacterium]
MSLALYQVDAFTPRLFAGNPAAVVPLTDWLPEAMLQAIAAENNLSETAFFCLDQTDPIRLRWFTPTQEVPLCGHATLASAFVILTLLDPGRDHVTFTTLSGNLHVRRGDTAETLVMQLPRYHPRPCDPPPALLAALPGTPTQVLSTAEDTNYYVVYDQTEQVRRCQPDWAQMSLLAPYNVAITAPGDALSQTDVVCRYFAPNLGIPEDPVTGAIQCGLVPYWASRLGQSAVSCQQLSARQGWLRGHLGDNHIELHGQARLYLSGSLHL